MSRIEDARYPAKCWINSSPGSWLRRGIHLYRSNQQICWTAADRVFGLHASSKVLENFFSQQLARSNQHICWTAAYRVFGLHAPSKVLDKFFSRQLARSNQQRCWIATYRNIHAVKYWTANHFLTASVRARCTQQSAG